MASHRHTRALVASILFLLFCAPCHAAVLERDWKSSGDGLLTYDTINRREWLDLSQTLLDDRFPGTSAEERFQFVVGQTDPGGMFAGFSVARAGDVTELATSAGINVNDVFDPSNISRTTVLIELLDYTPQPANLTNKLAVGLLDEVEDTSPNPRISSVFYVDDIYQAGLFFTNSPNLQRPYPFGVMLARTAVPEPRSTAILAVLLAIISAAHHLLLR